MSRTPNTTPAVPTDTTATHTTVTTYATAHGARSYIARATAPTGWYLTMDMALAPMTDERPYHVLLVRDGYVSTLRGVMSWDDATAVPTHSVDPTATLPTDDTATGGTDAPARHAELDRTYRANHGITTNTVRTVPPARDRVTPFGDMFDRPAYDRADAMRDAMAATTAPTATDDTPAYDTPDPTDDVAMDLYRAAHGTTAPTATPDNTVTTVPPVGAVIHGATPGSVRIIHAGTGTRVRFNTYDDTGNTGTDVGVIGRQTGMARLGNRGYVVTTPDGTEHVVSRYAYVVPVADDDDAPTCSHGVGVEPTDVCDACNVVTGLRTRSTYGVDYIRTDIPTGADPRTYPNTVYVTANTMNDAMTYVGHAYGTVTNIWLAPTATPTDAVTADDLRCTVPHPAPTYVHADTCASVYGVRGTVCDCDPGTDPTPTGARIGVRTMAPLPNGAATHHVSWNRVINGRTYSFDAITMANGEHRWSVSVFNGYVGGPRWGCAWDRVHFITIPGPNGTYGHPITPDAPSGDDTPRTMRDLSRMIGDGTYTVTPDGHGPTHLHPTPDTTDAPTYPLRNAVWSAVRMEWVQLRDGIMTRVSPTYAPDGTRSCGHSYGGYGACIAPYGHANRDHVDAHGHRFYGTALGRYPTGDMAPAPIPGSTRVGGITITPRVAVGVIGAPLYGTTRRVYVHRFDTYTDAVTYLGAVSSHPPLPLDRHGNTYTVDGDNVVWVYGPDAINAWTDAVWTTGTRTGTEPTPAPTATDRPTTYPRTLPLGPGIPGTMTVGADGITRLAYDIARMVAARADRDGTTPRDAYRAIVADATRPTYDYDTDHYRADDDTPDTTPAPATREHIHGGRRCHHDHPGTTPAS